MLLERARATVDPGCGPRSGRCRRPCGGSRATTSAGSTRTADRRRATPARRSGPRWSSPRRLRSAGRGRGRRRSGRRGVELVHNFTLLHDDVMDRDTTRRHRPTAWTVFGDADAILAGDALQALALRLLAEDPHPASRPAAARLADCVIELCEGQQADTALERRAPGEVTLDEVLAMAEAKTGALLGCACALGGLYAGAADEDVAALDAFGRQAGLAFQLIDDVIGIWGDPSRTGKPAGADLAARKKSLPVVAALASGTPAAAELAALYARPDDEGGPGAASPWPWSARAAATGRRARRPTGWPGRCSSWPGRCRTPEAAGGLLALAEFVTRRSS